MSISIAICLFRLLTLNLLYRQGRKLNRIIFAETIHLVLASEEQDLWSVTSGRPSFHYLCANPCRVELSDDTPMIFRHRIHLLRPQYHIRQNISARIPYVDHDFRMRQ